MGILTNINRVVIFISAAIFLTLRLAGDIVFFSLGMFDSPGISFWRIVSSVVVVASVVLYFFSTSTESTIDDNDNLSEKYISEYLKHLFFMMILGVLVILLPEQLPDFSEDRKFLSFFIAELTILTSILVAGYSLWFLFKWMLIRRHKKTTFYLKIIGIGLTYLFFVEILSNIFPVVKNLDTMNKWFIFLMSIIVFLVSKKNTWIASLPRARKFRIFWVSFSTMIISLIIAITFLETESTFGATISTNLPGAAYLFASSLLFVTFHSTRIFFAVVAAFPTTSIVERKTSELTTLTYLNRFITESASKDISYLLNTVTQLALHASGGSGVWTEVYDGEEVSIGSSVNINPESLTALHEQFRLIDIFKQLKKPLLIESIPETSELVPILAYIPKANSLIAVPLYQGSNRFGTLVVIDSEEYGFEYDDIKILEAFGDNVNLALENSRLLKDSIEKERALSELKIAKRIQKELLPHSLPSMKYFNVAAFTSPAEEVGGDYYDVAKFIDGKPCLLIGDVSGKGMSAAFYMAQLKGVVQSLAEQTSSPAELLRKINRTIYGLMDKQSYITMLCIKLDDDSGEITMARAGHPPLLIKSGTEVAMHTPKGLGIGLAKSKVFDQILVETVLVLNDGDSCVLLTDGISELRNHLGEELGYEPIKTALLNCNSDPNHLIDDIKQIAEKHLNGLAAHDDITLMAVSYHKMKI